MGDILELIKSRRTIKNFLPKFVSWDYISRIIDAGRHAPSCGNIQNWKFIVVYDADRKQQLAKACHEQYDFSSASMMIVICAEVEKAERYYGERGVKLYMIQNCAAAAQNMLLEAHSLGLGGAWISAFDEEEVKGIFGMPPEVSAQIVLAIGYPREIPGKPPKYPLEAVIYFQRWRSKMRDPAKYLNDIATILARKANAAHGAVKEAASLIVDKTKEMFNDEKKH